MATHTLYSEHADTIESVLAYTRSAHRLSADDGEEFSSWARLRLLEDDCAVLQKYRGLSSFRGYLVAVIQRLLLDWRIAEWGRWRPSAEAVRLGPVAIELEKLVLRDRASFDQAVESIVTRRIAAGALECEQLWVQLPRRPLRRRASDVAVDEMAVRLPAAPDPVETAEDVDVASRALTALAAIIPELPAQEQLMIRLRYQDGFTVARIALLLKVEQKPLYRRFADIHARLRERLAAAGVTETAVRQLLGNHSVELAEIFSPDEPGNSVSRPSTPQPSGDVS